MSSRRTFPFLAAAAACVALAGCGDDDEGVGDPIRDATARNLIAQLDDFQDALDSGDCESIPDRIQNLRSQVSRLGGEGVGPDVQDALDDGVDHLRSLALGPDVCDADDEEVETTPETVPEITTPTETVPPPTTETTPPPTETTPPPTVTTPVEPPEEDDGGLGPDGNGPPGQLKDDED